MQQSPFKKRLWKAGRLFVLVFVLLFVFRLIYGFVSNDTRFGQDLSYDFFNSVTDLRKNYASEKIQVNVAAQASMASSQKYEKTATVRTKSSDFEKDVIKTKAITDGFAGVIQYEHNSGNKGNRQVQLLIGIIPEKFDSFYVEIQKIGKVSSTDITKIDKTNEYRQLNARKASMEKNLASLNELKSKGGAINDYISLHDKILELELQMQQLGVELGNFNTENEFCTVKFSLYEGATERKVSVMTRVKVALQWTIKYYAMLVFGAAAALTAAFILLLILDKLNVIRSIVNKVDE